MKMCACFGLSFEGCSIVDGGAGMPFENGGDGGSPATGANRILVV
jgi:hypothetical protein